MKSSCSTALLSLTLAFTSALAQGAPYLEVLTVPPDSVGTCLPLAAKPGTPVAALSGRHISIKTRDPNGSRDIMVFADDHGRVRRYSDRQFVSTGPLSGVGDFVVAMTDTAVRLHGFTVHDTIRIHARRPGTPPDTAELRALRERTHPNQQPITTAEQAKIITVATWLLRRCRG